MTGLLFVFGVALAGLAGRLLARAITVPRMQIKSHLEALTHYGIEAEQAAPVVDRRTRLNVAMTEFAGRAGRFAAAHLPTLRQLNRSDLSAAGFYDSRPDVVHGYRAIAGVTLPTVLLLLVAMGGGGFSLSTLLLLLFAMAIGWQLPALVIRRRGSSRLEDIDRHLPDLIDLLIATIEAGMGFAGSLSLIAGRFEGALGDELRLAIKQQSLGSSSAQALEDMVTRCDTPSVRVFVRTITRGESLGGSIAPILRELAVDMRRRRRQAARERMQKAPIKLIFPLMFLVFPAMMIVLLFPAAYSVFHNVKF